MPSRFLVADRPDIQHYFLQMIDLVASRSTCGRRRVGAIITDEQGHVLSMGYNGVPSGIEHCLDFPCEGIDDRSGDTSRCLAVHAEQNAIVQCHRLDLAWVIYTTSFPCFTCAKLIANTKIQRVVYRETYAETLGFDLLDRIGLELVQVPK